jgi:hypothetical protein
MKRPVDIRAAPKDWKQVLKASYPFLRQQGVGDLLLYGSQAMSVYMKNPLRSKDLDLVSSQIGPQHHQALRDKLAQDPTLEVRSSTVQSKPLPAGEMRTYSVELRLSGRPFFLEIFDKVLDGQSPSIITPHVQTINKWGLDLWVPSPNALVALRLSFRQPEGISPLNCKRLNTFIKEQRRKLEPKKIGQLITQWGMGQTVRTNLDQLHRRHNLRVLREDQIISYKP